MPTTNTPTTLVLTLSPADAKALYDATHSPVRDAIADFLVAQGGDQALVVGLDRAVAVTAALANSEDELRRRKAAEKLDNLTMALEDLSSELHASPTDASYLAAAQAAVHSAFDALGRVTRSKLPESVSALVASVPAGQTESYATCGDSCGCA